MVIGSIGATCYTLGNVSETAAWIAMMISWALSLGILPVWTYMMDGLLNKSICSGGNGPDCAAREALLAGLGIVTFSSWILSFSLLSYWFIRDVEQAVHEGQAREAQGQGGSVDEQQDVMVKSEPPYGGTSVGQGMYSADTPRSQQAPTYEFRSLPIRYGTEQQQAT